MMGIDIDTPSGLARSFDDAAAAASSKLRAKPEGVSMSMPIMRAPIAGQSAQSAARG